MPIYTVGSTRVALQQPDLTTFQANGSVVLDSRRVRPLWFDGRFLAARDLEREQDYFLQRQADLGQAGGFEVMSGLMVDQTTSDGQPVDPGAIVIHAGEGITPAGEMVSVPNDLTVALSSLSEQPILDAQAGISTAPPQPTQTRTGLYVIALQPLEFTGNPITAYPTTVAGPLTTHDGDIIEATAVSLVPYPNPASSFTAPLLQGALARQIFVTGNPVTLPDSLLPLALVSLQQGSVNWIDPYLVRRDTGPEYSGVRFGLTDPASQQAFAMQYEMQLQSVVAARQASGLKANFAASDYFQALPPAGHFPLDTLDTSGFSQVFFPQEMDVRLSIVPSDELPALIQDSLSLPPIDLTLPPDAYSSMAVFALIPVPPDNFAALKSTLPDTPLNPILPQVLANRSPFQLLRLYQGGVTIIPVPPIFNNAWATAIGSQKYGFYLRRRSNPTFVNFIAPTGVALSSSANPSTVGQTVIFTAGLSPSSATGSVQFLDGTTDLGTVPLSGGIASLSISTLTVGSHNITAAYGGDANDAASTSTVLTQIVNLASSSVNLTSSVNPSTVGQPVTFTANVSPASATGSVQFLDGTTDLGTATVSAGVASLTIALTPSGDPVLSPGTHPITAVYGGDGSTAASTSPVLTQIVTKLTPNIALSSSANPSTLGEAVTFTANLSPGSPTGNVQFLDGTTVLGTSAISAGAATLTVALTAAGDPVLKAGIHSITAVYGGDGRNAANTSAVLMQTVTKAASAVELNSSVNPSTLGETLTL